MMERPPHGLRGRSRGQAMVEFAMVLPMYLIMALALVDFSRLLFTYVSLSNGARELARLSAITSGSAGSNANAIGAFQNFTIVGGPTVSGTTATVTVTDSTGTRGTLSCSGLPCDFSVAPSGTNLSVSAGTSSTAGVTHSTGSAVTCVLASCSITVDDTVDNGDLAYFTVIEQGGEGTGIVCTLPTIQASATCPFPSRRVNAGDGWIDVGLTYHFRFNPLFEGPFGVSFIRPWSLLTVATRTYAE